MVTSVYRKPTFSGLAISSFSICAYRFKNNAIKTLLCRAYNVSANYQLLHREFEFLKQFFGTNGFPLKLIDTLFRKFLSKCFEPTVSEPLTKQKFYISVPCFGCQSDRLANELSASLFRFVPHCVFVLIEVNLNKIGSLFNYKDRLPTPLHSFLVYKFRCARCACEYVGSTSRILHTRVRVHEGRSHRTGALLSVASHSNIRLHSQSCGVSFSESDLKILSACERNRETLLILESMFILRNKPKNRLKSTIYPLPINSSFASVSFSRRGHVGFFKHVHF